MIEQGGEPQGQESPALKALLAGGMLVVGYGVGLCPTCVANFASAAFGSVICYIIWNGAHYSIGPDIEDDGMAIAYDPTNGTLSRGDIAVPAGGGR